MDQTDTFWAVFLDMEDERPDAYFCTEEDARKYLESADGGKFGDVLPIKMTWYNWMKILTGEHGGLMSHFD